MDLQVGVKILMKNKEGNYLVLLRSAVKYPDAGAQWEIVGGRIDPGSPLLENLKREVREETGLEITGMPKLIAGQDILKSTKHIVRLTYMGEGSGDVVLSDEHTDYKWLPIEEIKKLDPIDGYLKEVLENLN
jgi:8-oxo-dGTP pyrophosphatase MutT (NUDIX family)